MLFWNSDITCNKWESTVIMLSYDIIIMIRQERKKGDREIYYCTDILWYYAILIKHLPYFMYLF